MDAISLNDPDRLLTEWEALIAIRPGIHPPEAAGILGVSEAAFVASRIGTGATRLKADVAGLLSKINEWGRVLCAFSNDLGVHMPLGEVNALINGPDLLIRGLHMRATIKTMTINEAYLFIEKDRQHGNTRSLQFFDDTGAPVLKVYIFHKAKFAACSDHFENYKHHDQSRRANAKNLKINQGTLLSKEQKITLNQTLTEIFQNPGKFEIEMLSKHTWVEWYGSLGQVRIDNQMFHLHEQDIRSHIRLNMIEKVKNSEDGGLLLLNENSSALKIKRRK